MMNAKKQKKVLKILSYFDQKFLSHLKERKKTFPFHPDKDQPIMVG